MVKPSRIAILFALFLVIGYCQANSNYVVSRGENEAKDREDLLPYLILMNGANSVAPSVCILSMLSLGVAYLFSRYT